MWHWIIELAAVLGVLFLVGGCSLYNRPYPVSPAPQPGYDLRVVQFDDFGSFWDSNTAQQILSDVEAQSQSMTSSTFVVVFTHGWHHNAAPDDDNLQNFRLSLGKLFDQLSQPQRQAARKVLTGSAEFKLIGIYTGWRGRSLPGFLDYGTMWWRKTAAERVGDGDLSEFLERLQRIYLRANAYSRYVNNPGHTPLTGLVTIGHSFGGQAVLNAVARPIEEDLTMRAPCVTDAVKPVVVPSTPTEELVPMDSFGDLNILLNPATEAYQFARLDGLYRQLAYPYKQAPQLVIFSADNDSARQWFFPIARGLTRPFRPKFQNSHQGELWGKALGEFVDQRTHELNLAAGQPDSLTDDDFKPGNQQKIAKYDFSSPTVFSGVKLTRLPNTPVITNSPIEVIYSHDKIIDGHNGIFQPVFLDFLAQYIAFIEGKRIVLRYQDFEERRTKGQVAASATPAPTPPNCASR